MTPSRPTVRSFTVDGYRMAYQDVGPARGPVIVMVHGLVSDRTTWQRSAAELAARGFRVIAPDLLGHGDSEIPPDGYALETFSRHIAELLHHLRIRHATVVGHSYGAAVAMAIAHHHPELAGRLVLVAAGGLGKEVHPVFRAATLPGARTVLGLLVNERTAQVYRRPGLHRRLRLSPEAVANLGRAGRGLTRRSGRDAFFATLHTAIRPSGQRGSMVELEFIDRSIPVLLMWSNNDPVVPVDHAHYAHSLLPLSRLVVFDGSTHQPHHHRAAEFTDALAHFVEDYPPRRSPGSPPADRPATGDTDRISPRR